MERNDNAPHSKPGALHHLDRKFDGGNPGCHFVHGLRNEIRPPEPINQLMTTARIEDQNSMGPKEAIRGGEHSLDIGKRPCTVGITEVMDDLIAHNPIEDIVWIGKIDEAAAVKCDR